MGYIDGSDISLKSHVKTGVLCLIGGALGMHRLYVEKIGSALIMATLFFGSFVGLIIHPVVWGVLLGMDVLAMGVDFFRIMFNDFEDSDGKKISPENAIRDKEPIFYMLLFCTLGVYALFAGSLFGNYIPSIVLFALSAIFVMLEFRYI